MSMIQIAEGWSTYGARGLKMGVTGVTGVTGVASFIMLLIYKYFIGVTPLRTAFRLKCYERYRCYIGRHFELAAVSVCLCLN